jgi:hypothetical protein
MKKSMDATYPNSLIDKEKAIIADACHVSLPLRTKVTI